MFYYFNIIFQINFINVHLCIVDRHKCMVLQMWMIWCVCMHNKRIKMNYHRSLQLWIKIYFKNYSFVKWNDTSAISNCDHLIVWAVNKKLRKQTSNKRSRWGNLTLVVCFSLKNNTVCVGLQSNHIKRLLKVLNLGTFNILKQHSFGRIPRCLLQSKETAQFECVPDISLHTLFLSKYLV